jgi:hypothetical protein
MSVQDREQEATWVQSIFEENYGMLDFKQSKYGFAWDKVVSDYKAAATAPDVTAEQF